MCYTGTDLNTVVNAKTEAGNIIGMKKGASIKIDPAVSGLRYKSEISVKAIDALEEIFGQGSVSYGTIIAPEAFVTSAGDNFTAEELDAWAAIRDDMFKNGAKAYVDVPATKWFEGESGVISGSIVNMAELYKEDFVGRAYIKVTVDNKTVVTLYADYLENDIANSTRSVDGIATSAVNDLLYKKGDSYYEKNNGTYVAVTDAARIDEYKQSVGTEGEYTKYSCYSESEYKALTDLVTLING